MKKISVCVPSYNRPETLDTLIKTFLKQDYPNKELVISDDTPNDSILKLVKNYKNSSIKYFHNNPGLGFSKNYLDSMLHATGDYLFTIGDDDILVSKHVLSTYVDVFNKYPKVGYIYANLVQFSDSMQVEYIINTFDKDTYFKQGDESMYGLWTTSIFIGGIGIRNTSQLKKLYPEKKILHPQVQLIGEIINRSDSYGLSQFCVGVRSHQDQIIFRALTNKKIKQDGKHMNTELFEILKKLQTNYAFTYNKDDLAKKLLPQTAIMLYKEKSVLGNAMMQENYHNFLKQSSIPGNNLKFTLHYYIALLIPSFFVEQLRSLALFYVQITQKNKLQKFQSQINFMTK